MIDHLPPGRELDAKVAEEMGWTDIHLSPINGELIGLKPGVTRPPSGKTSHLSSPTHYSTDIAAAWGIVEQLTESHYVTIGFDRFISTWWCQIAELGSPDPKNDQSCIASCDAAPHAICLAFLKAMEAHE